MLMLMSQLENRSHPHLYPEVQTYNRVYHSPNKEITNFSIALSFIYV